MDTIGIMMEFTQEQLVKAGYEIKAAPVDDWRKYDEQAPIPGYFQFDWLSARHPDLYHKFALSSLGLVNELNELVDLSGLTLADIGAGTGRITLGLATRARRIIAVDVFEAVGFYGKKLVEGAGFRNVDYVRGKAAGLPLPDNSVDAAVCAWAVINYPEAYRVIKPNGYLIDLLPAPGALCGELTALLADVYPELITEIAPAEQFDPAFPTVEANWPDDTWNGIPVTAPIRLHDFTYVAEYNDYHEAAAILGRLYGPRVRQYLLERRQSGVAWRLRIVINRIRK